MRAEKRSRLNLETFTSFNYDAVIHFENLENDGIPEGQQSIMVQAAYLGQEGESNEVMGNLILNDVAPIPFITEFEGHTQTLSNPGFEGESIDIQWFDAKDDLILTDTIYYPARLEAVIPSGIGTNSTISWDPDPNNSKGVVIYIRTEIDRDYLIPTANSEDVYDFLDSDDGTYTFNNQIIGEILSAREVDSEHLIEVAVLRGDYKISPSLKTPSDKIAISTLHGTVALCSLFD